jgi:hypothetical protein
MAKRGSVVWALVGVLATTGTVQAAENVRSSPATARGNWITEFWWNPWARPPKQDEKKKLAKADTDVEKKAAARADKDMSPETKQPLKLKPDSERTRAQQDLFRRLDVCDQLKVIANQTRDDTLMRQADALDMRAWEVYKRRIAVKPVDSASADAADLAISTVSDPVQKSEKSDTDSKGLSKIR